ncbi:linear amide C-N hydrolase [Planctomicrobium sp. SH661]|uniref:linear amide C-N hydrolase n=1 Tax=Planctomicrobium sp. SH661 TaxID=3448124 RepID=UPI003F5BBADB
MIRGRLSKKLFGGLACLVSGVALAPALTQACTRALYLGPENTVVVARSMDWMEDPGTNIYKFPKGMQRDGAAGANSIKWTSKYGSIVCAFYEAASVDGMNDQGLVANTLYLVESNYGEPGDKPTLNIAAWGQYVLDNYATVAEAVEALKKEPFVIIAPILPNGEPAQGHLSISDPSGDSAIIEYVDGKQVIHHGRECQVMTNSPTYDKQLTLNAYWERIGGSVMLPGTNRAADRFVRASFYVTALPQTADEKESIASVFSLIRSVSVPLGITTPGQPNIASTIWRTVYDQKRKIMYFDSATSPNVFWIPLDDPALKSGNTVQKLDLSGGKTYSGNAAAAFQPAKPFEFLQSNAGKK